MLKNITLIGSGNVATHLGRALYDKGFSIHQVYSPNKDNAFELAVAVSAMPCDDLKFITDESDVYIICVKDEAIAEVANQITFKYKLVVHTAGSIGMEVLDCFEQHGVLYPLQTFSKKTTLHIHAVPFCIEANNALAKKQLIELANQLSPKVHEITSEQRKKIHLAAVFACNFSNYCYGVAAKILTESDIDFELLKPLILETAQKIQHQSPQKAQTGPAQRNDQATINNHLQLLENSKHYQEIYELMSAAIGREIGGGE